MQSTRLLLIQPQRNIVLLIVDFFFDGLKVANHYATTTDKTKHFKTPNEHACVYRDPLKLVLSSSASALSHK